MKVAFEVKDRADYRAYKEPDQESNFGYLPEPDGDEHPYILSLSEGCPFFQLDFFGQLSFHKYIHTVSTKQKPQTDEQFLVKYLADNQVQAVKNRAARKFIKMGKRFDSPRKPQLEFIQFDRLPDGDYPERLDGRKMREILARENNPDGKSVDELERMKAEIEKRIAEAKKKKQKREDQEAEALENSEQEEEAEAAETKKRTRRKRNMRA